MSWSLPGDRAGLIGAIFTVSYLSLGIPAPIAGAATSRYGLHHTALAYFMAIAVLAAAAAGSFQVRGSHRTGAAHRNRRDSSSLAAWHAHPAAMRAAHTGNRHH